MTHLIAQIESAKPFIGISAACLALDVPHTTYYRRTKPVESAPARPEQKCRVPGRGLTQEEQDRVVAALNSDRFVDMAPPQVYSTLLDEGVFHCSISTMYRLLRKRGEINERRKLRRHRPAARPELLATGPNQVWSWDITKLKGPRRWTYYYLYVVIDVFSRCVVGWCICAKSSAKIAEALLQDAIARERIAPGQLTIHADNGGEMVSITVAELLTDMGVIKSHSRPHTSNDNPFSESHFKTMKYRPEVPDRFESVEQAREIFRKLFHWYNNKHRHSGLALMTPASVHAGEAAQITQARAEVLTAAFNAHPGRFVNKAPKPLAPPTEVWINPPFTGSEPSRDGSEPVTVLGQQELPAVLISCHEPSKRKRSTEASRDASGQLTATGPQKSPIVLNCDERNQREICLEPSRDGSGGCDAATA